MQRGVVGVLKDIFETLKKEIKGPKVNSGKLESEFVKIKEKKTDNLVDIYIKKLNNSIDVKDMNSENIINVNEASFSKKVEREVLLLQDQISIVTEGIKIEGSRTKVEKIDIERSKANVYKIDTDFNKKTGIKKKMLTVYSKILNGKKKILEVPKRIKGKTIYNYRKNELEIIIKKLRKKLKNKSLSDYAIEGIFEDIPVKNVKNIKYFKEENLIELYFDGKSFGGTYAQFVVLANKNNALVEKIFI